jgi:hypothetical protein
MCEITELKGFGCKTKQDAQIQIVFNLISFMLLKMDDSEEVCEKLHDMQEALKRTYA